MAGWRRQRRRLLRIPTALAHRWGWGLVGFGALAVLRLSATVIFHEIHYHPASEDLRDEFVELYNSGTNAVLLTGWKLQRGVEFTFPAVTLPPQGYLVVAADPQKLRQLHPQVTNVVGPWSGRLSNSRDTLELVDGAGGLVDRVTYADEGDWAVRLRSPPDRGQRGWTWTTPADGAGPSLELVNPVLPNESGQNWAPSLVPGGTPGRANSVARTNLAPMILEVRHDPPVPRSTDRVWITACVIDEQRAGVRLNLYWRLDGSPGFTVVPMADDGRHEDGLAGDGWYGAFVPPQTNDAIVEFYLEAQDSAGLLRLWPAPAVETNGLVLGPVANALYQVEDVGYSGPFPLYRIVMTEAERRQLAYIGSATDGTANSDAQMNATFLSHEAGEWTVRYLVGVRNRGHGSRNRQPNNYRVNFRSDDPWRGVVALNLNGQYSHLQVLGAALALKAGLAGAFSRPVQVRVNNRNLANNGPETYGGCYAANEVVNSDWAERWFPEDPAGNVYRALRDLPPSVFAWRGTNVAAYTNTWFKWTNTSENDWSDLLALLRVLGTNDLFNAPAVSNVLHLEQWMTFFAVMALFDNRETSLYSGYNDDYLMYAGAVDRRFRLLYYDLDSILGQGGHPGSTTGDFLEWTRDPDLPGLQRLWSLPVTRTVFYRTLDRLMRTTFNEPEFATTVDQTLRDFVPEPVRRALKEWMASRRRYLGTQISAQLSADPPLPRATISGEPRSPTPRTWAVLRVGGDRLTHYRYRLNAGPWSEVRPVTATIVLTNLPHGSTNQVAVLGADADGLWQPEFEPTLSLPWVVLTHWPAVRINEVMARNVRAVPHEGTWPDWIELYNESDRSVDLSGLRLTDNPASPGKFVFPTGTVLPAGGYLIVWAAARDGGSGLYTGFALNQEGEGVYLFDRVSRGGALLDGVSFGLQLADLSIGRVGDAGSFVLTRPTPGTANEAQPLGPVSALRINEWLARAQHAATSDFVELYNPLPLPVALGGLYLTDNPIGQPRRHRLTDLSFIAPGGFQRFWADGNPGQGADHLSFKLSSEQGLIALLDPELQVLDLVSYGPQQPDISEGRVPDGGHDIRRLTLPTAGAANAAAPPPCTVEVESVPLLGLSDVWRFQQSTNLDGAEWFSPAYNDQSWSAGPGLLAFETNPSLTNLIQTPLQDPRRPPVGSGLKPGHAVYFRRWFAFSNDPAAFTFVLTAYIDDGAVVYLNGREVFRLRMPPGEVSVHALATASPPGGDALQPDSFLLPAGWVVPGSNLVAVSVHQEATNSSDVLFGLSLTATRTLTNCVRAGVVLNEICARPASSADRAGPAGGWVELVNVGPQTVDLSGLSLSDDLQWPRRWVFPQGTMLPAGQRLLLACNPDRPVSSTNTGFGLSAAGGVVYLLDRPELGQRVLDAVSYGAQAAGFTLARIPDAAGDWQLGIPTPAGPNVPAALGSPVRLRINEWMAAPASGEDWIELYNPAEQPVELSGLSLSDDPSDRRRSPFPARSYLGPRDFWFVQADGRLTITADHARFRLARQGGWIGLYLATGQMIDGVVYGPQEEGISEGRLPDGTDTVMAFPGTATPGQPNYIPLPHIVIHEVLTHAEPPMENAIELHNPSPQPVDVSGWFLSDDATRPAKYRFPTGSWIPAGGFVVVYESQFGDRFDPNTLEPFVLDPAHGGEVVLSEVRDGFGTGRKARVAFGAADQGISFGRVLTSWTEEFVPLSRPTFGVDSPRTLEEFRSGRGAPNAPPKVGPVILSEIHADPVAAFDPVRPGSGQFVELLNVSEQPVPLFDPRAPEHRWRLSGSIDFVFPTGLSLPPHGLVLVVDFDPMAQPEELAWFREVYQVPVGVPVVGPWLGQLDRPAGTVMLLKPDLPRQGPDLEVGYVPYVLVERVQYVGGSPWPWAGSRPGASLQRIRLRGLANEPLHWVAAPPTAGTGGHADRDRDGLPDWWENQHGLDPESASDIDGPAGDPDGDGQSNAAEYVAGTDPRRAADVLRIAQVQADAQGLVLRFVAVAGRTYRVLCSEERVDGPWYVWTNLAPARATGSLLVRDDRPMSRSRYYRLQVFLEP